MRRDRRRAFGEWRREVGFSLMETVAAIGIGTLVMGIGAYTYWAISRQDRSHVAVEREVARLRDDLVKAHLQAQRGTSTGIRFHTYNLVVVPEASGMSGLSHVSFVPPEGHLSPDCLPFGPGMNTGLRFRVGRDETWYAFAVARDGSLHAERSMKPHGAPPSGGPPGGSPPGGSPPPGYPGDNPPDKR